MGLTLGFLAVVLLLCGAAKFFFGDLGAWIVFVLIMFALLVWICMVVLPHKKGIDIPYEEDSDE